VTEIVRSTRQGTSRQQAVDGNHSGRVHVALVTLRWWVVLTAVALASVYLSNSTPPALESWWGFLQALASRLWVIYPFVAFAGGLAASSRPRGTRAASTSVIVVTVLLGGIAYVTGVLLVPVAELEADRRAGIDVEARYPLGAETPGALARQRAAVLERPPHEYRFSVDRPFEHPPNWLTYLLHQPVALYVFAVVNALLGLAVGWSTTGLSPPRRRQVRWFIGIAAALAFYVVAAWGTQWVRASPENSGIVGAWLPLTLPLLALIGTYVGGRSRGRPDLHDRGHSGV
jgi:hypothetical protein